MQLVRVNRAVFKEENIIICTFFQCCGAGAGGAEIILGPGAGAENKC